MSSKKETYSSITRKINALLKQQDQEKQRMAGIMSSALLSDQNASLIGDFSDAELRRLMHLLSSHLSVCISQLDSERQSRRAIPSRGGNRQPGLSVSSSDAQSHMGDSNYNDNHHYNAIGV